MIPNNSIICVIIPGNPFPLGKICLGEHATEGSCGWVTVMMFSYVFAAPPSTCTQDSQLWLLQN